MGFRASCCKYLGLQAWQFWSRHCKEAAPLKTIVAGSPGAQASVRVRGFAGLPAVVRGSWRVEGAGCWGGTTFYALLRLRSSAALLNQSFP